MSLICCISNYGHPVIITDLAISGSDNMEPIVIPLLNKEHTLEDFNDAIKPVSFKIKNIIIKEKIYVGASGEMNSIKELFSHIEDYFLHREPTLENFEDFSKSHDLASKYSNCSAIYLISNGALKLPHMFSTGKWTIESDAQMEKVIWSGTGGDEWSRSLIESSGLMNPTENINPANTISSVLIKVMQFLEEERMTPDNLKNGWGGGFDICRFLDGSFVRVNQICYAFWDFDKDSAEKLVKPKNLLRFSYVEESLWIQHFDGNFKHYEIQSIHRTPPRITLQNPYEFTCTQIISCVYIKKNEEIETRLFYSDFSKEQLVHSTTIDGNLAFGISTQFIERLTAVIIDSLS